MSEHDSRCEREYAENGFVFIDCLCNLRSAKARAWDEGKRAMAHARLMQGGDDPQNPYRVTD